MAQVATPGQLSMSWCGGQAVFLTRCPSALFSCHEQPLGRRCLPFARSIARFAATRASNSAASCKSSDSAPRSMLWLGTFNSQKRQRSVLYPCFSPVRHQAAFMQRLHRFFRLSSHSFSFFGQHFFLQACSSGRGRHATTTPQGGAFHLCHTDLQQSVLLLKKRALSLHKRICVKKTGFYFTQRSTFICQTGR